MAVKIPEKDSPFSRLDRFKISKDDLIAGISVACVAIPQSLAYAALAGVPVYYGLYALSIPTFLAAFLGTSTILSTGPVAAISLLTAALLQQFQLTDPAQIVMYAATLAVLVGLIQITLGLSKLGTLINYIARPVMIGFTMAAAIVIAFSQVPQLLGLTVAKHEHFLPSVWETLKHVLEFSFESSLFGLISLLFIVILKKKQPLFPAGLIAVVISILLSQYMSYDGAIIGAIPAGLPEIKLYNYTALPLSFMLPNALVIALVGFMESMTIVKSLAQKTRDRLDPNKELLAQGAANLSSGMIGSFPVAGSVSRTVLNYSVGAKSKMASIVLSIIALIAILGLSRVLYYLPFATLAAVIIAAVMNLINPHEIYELYKTRRREALVALFTFGCTLLFAPHLDYGIVFGVIASISVYLHKTARPHIEIFFCHDKDYLHSQHYHLHTYPSNKKVMGVSVESSLTFTNATYVYDTIMQELNKHKRPKYVLLLCNRINYIDSSAEQVLQDIHNDLANQNIELLLAGLPQRIIDELHTTKVYDYLGGDHIYPKANLALKAIYRKQV